MDSQLLQETLATGLRAIAEALSVLAELVECQLEVLSNLDQSLQKVLTATKPREKPSKGRRGDNNEHPVP